MSPEMRQKRIIEALNRNVLKGSEIRPVIMAVEDLHWIDKSSEERFKYLLDSISGARVYLIFTYRPEYVHTWGGKSFHSQVTLNRLSNRESLAMVAYLLGTEDIDSDLETLILEKTEGVVDPGEDGGCSLFHRGVYKIPSGSKDYREEGEQILLSKRYQGPSHTFYHPRCDNGQSGLPFRGCEGGSSDWLSRRPRVQPRFNRKGVGPI
jgi:hypothetical protein